VKTRLWEPEGRGLLRRFRDGEAAVPAFAEDYASLVLGLIELARADPGADWLAWAVDLQARLDARFWDEVGGGWYATTADDPSIRVRIKEDHDGAEPSATSLAAWNLLALEELTGRRAYGQRADAALRAFATPLTRMPRAVPMMALVLSARHARARPAAQPANL
jgi:hypothetical protein